MRKSGCAPSSRGNSSSTPGTTARVGRPPPALQGSRQQEYEKQCKRKWGHSPFCRPEKGECPHLPVAHHQSSFTARTTSAPIACRPLNADVSAAAAIEHGAQCREQQPRDVHVHRPMERLAVHDVDQDQADDAADDEAGRDPHCAERRALERQHPADLAARHAEVTQHPELRRAAPAPANWCWR